MPDDDQKTAEQVAKRLLGTMKKYTHTIQMKAGNAVVIEHDDQIYQHSVEGVAGRVLTVGYSMHVFFVRLDDVLFYHTETNTTE